MEQNKESRERIDAIENKIGYTFKKQNLLETAFIHKSYYLDKTMTQQEDNERLEFLGDSVLSLIVSSFLFEYCPDVPEGVLTQLREQIVDSLSLREYTEILQVSQYCLVGKGEEKTLQESSILADLFEAILGAIYLDGGYTEAYNFFIRHLQPIVETKIKSPKRNWKKELQEKVQSEFQEVPAYAIDEEQGPAHKKQFTVSVRVQGKVVGRGVGMSKKEAEMRAAQDAVKSAAKDAVEKDEGKG